MTSLTPALRPPPPETGNTKQPKKQVIKQKKTVVSLNSIIEGTTHINCPSELNNISENIVIRPTGEAFLLDMSEIPISKMIPYSDCHALTIAKREAQKNITQTHKINLMKGSWKVFDDIVKSFRIDPVAGKKYKLVGKNVTAHSSEVLNRGNVLKQNFSNFYQLKSTNTWNTDALKQMEHLLNLAKTAFITRFQQVFTEDTVQSWQELFLQVRLPKDIGQILTNHEINFKKSISEILFEKPFKITYEEIVHLCHESLGYLVTNSAPLVSILLHQWDKIKELTSETSDLKTTAGLFNFPLKKEKDKDFDIDLWRKQLIKKVDFQMIPETQKLSSEQLITLLSKVKAAKTEQQLFAKNVTDSPFQIFSIL